jgi:hypothetical protein
MKAIRGELRILDLYGPTYVCSLEDRPPENLQKSSSSCKIHNNKHVEGTNTERIFPSFLNPIIEHDKKRNNLNL